MNLNLNSLVARIHSLEGTLKSEASKAVNILLTTRNWIIGGYIVEYVQKGEDRQSTVIRYLNALGTR